MASSSSKPATSKYQVTAPQGAVNPKGFWAWRGTGKTNPVNDEPEGQNELVPVGEIVELTLEAAMPHVKRGVLRPVEG